MTVRDGTQDAMVLFGLVKFADLSSTGKPTRKELKKLRPYLNKEDLASFESKMKKTALHPAAIGALLGTGLGVGLGYFDTNDKEHRLRNAIALGGIGAGFGALSGGIPHAITQLRLPRVETDLKKIMGKGYVRIKLSAEKIALHPSAWGALIGTPIGAGVGYFGTSDEDKKLRNALIGGGIGGGVGAAGAGLFGILNRHVDQSITKQIANDPYWIEKKKKWAGQASASKSSPAVTKAVDDVEAYRASVERQLRAYYALPKPSISGEEAKKVLKSLPDYPPLPETLPKTRAGWSEIMRQRGWNISETDFGPPE